MSASAEPKAATGLPAVAGAAGAAGAAEAARRPTPARERFGTLVEGWLRGHTILIYLFLYIPIIVVVIFSFNATNRRVTDWQGFSLKWYASVLSDKVVQSALANSLIVATSTAIISAVFGTMAALGLQRAPKWFRRPFEALTFVSIIVPEIVIALASLVFFSSSFDILNPIFGLKLKLGFPTIIAAHALFNSLIVATSTAVISSIFGTMAALGLQRAPKWFQRPFEALTFVSIIVPEIVIALATLVFFSSSFDILNPIFGLKLKLGFPTIIAAHALFNISLVMLLVRARLSGMDRTHVEASYDLFGTPWRTFWQITFPQLLPAIVAGFLLSFTFSFDDYVITTFVSGAGSTTLPLYVFSTIRKGVTPATNAVAAIMLIITLTILVVGQLIVARNARRSGGRSGASVAEMITDQSA
jgi:spermidine/putrescine transport system permease protein